MLRLFATLHDAPSASLRDPPSAFAPLPSHTTAVRFRCRPHQEIHTSYCSCSFTGVIVPGGASPALTAPEYASLSVNVYFDALMREYAAQCMNAHTCRCQSAASPHFPTPRGARWRTATPSHYSNHNADTDAEESRRGENDRFAFASRRACSCSVGSKRAARYVRCGVLRQSTP